MSPKRFGWRSKSVSGVPARCVAVTLLFFAPASVSAQTASLWTYGSEQGLPQQQVQALHQDALGYLWLGTYGGLSRFNGTGFVNYAKEEGLSANHVKALAQAADGRLAVATSGGVCFMEAEQFECLGSGDGLGKDDVFDLLPDPDGSLWMATSRGIARLQDGTLSRYTVREGLPSDRTLTVERDAEGRIWAGTEAGLARLVGERFITESPDLLASRRVQMLVPTPMGLLVGTDSLLLVWRDDRLTSVPLPDHAGGPSFRDAVVDRSGTVWIVTQQHGAFRYDAEGLHHVRSQIGGVDELYSVLVDREGSVWFGTGSGLSRLTPGPFDTFTSDDGLPGGLARAIAEDARGRVWIGTRAGVGIFERGQFRTVVPAESLPDPRVYALEPLPDGGLLIGTNAGLALWRDGIRRVYHREDGLPGERIRSMVTNPEGGVWISTRSGMALWKDGNVSAAPGDRIFSEAVAMDMLYDDRGRLWLALLSGVAVVDGDEASVLRAAQGLTDEIVWSLSLDPQGRVWVGTNGDGAFRVEPDSGEILHVSARGDGAFRGESEGGEILHVNAPEVLGNNYVWSTLADRSGSVWLFTGNGLDRYAEGSIRHYGRADGLQDLEGNATAALEASDGTLWFGAGGSLTRYSAGRDEGNSVSPKVVIEGATTERGRLTSGGELPSDLRSVSVRFRSLSFRNHTAVRYRHRLVGESDRWSEPTDDPDIHYAGLSPGRYEFQVLGSNDAGVWSTEPAVFPFTVQPAFWQTWWFRGALLLMLGATVRLILLIRTRHLEAERRHLRSVVEEKTAEVQRKNSKLEQEIAERRIAEAKLVQAQKMEAVGQLTGGIAHDFNNILTSIRLNAELVSGMLHGDHVGVQEDLDEIKEGADRGADLVRKLMAFSRKQELKLRPIDCAELIPESARLLERLLPENVRITATVRPGSMNVMADRNALDQILMNLATNARDAMPAGGELFIEGRVVQLDAGFRGAGDWSGPGAYVHLSVRDTGLGMDEATLRHVFEPFFTTKPVGQGTGLGLAMIYGLVTQLGGFAEVTSECDVGTDVSLYLPVCREEPEAYESGKTVQIGRGSETILVVEDDDAIRRGACRALERYGYTVLVACNGAQALAVLRSGEPRVDFVISDVVMPTMGGQELYEALAPGAEGPKFMFTTGYADRDRRPGHLDPRVPCLQKPWDALELVRVVREVLDGGAMLDETLELGEPSVGRW